MNRGRGGEGKTRKKKTERIMAQEGRLLSDTTQMLRAGVSTPRTHKHTHLAGFLPATEFSGSLKSERH